MRDSKDSQEILEYQPDAVEIEDKAGTRQNSLGCVYLIMFSLVITVVGSVVFKVDRIVVAQGRLITTTPTIVVQPLSTSIVRTINTRVGDVVEKDQVLVTLDATFASADLDQLSKQSLALDVQLRRIKAELANLPFSAQPGEGEEGRLQEQLLKQRKVILARSKRTIDDKIAALHAKIDMIRVQLQGRNSRSNCCGISRGPRPNFLGTTPITGSGCSMPRKPDTRRQTLSRTSRLRNRWRSMS